VSAIGILGGLAAAGAAYKEGKRNKEREARLEKYDAALADLRSAQADNLRSRKSPKPDIVVVKDGVADMSTLGMPGSYRQPDDGPEPLNSVPEVERGDELARGGVVGYANGGLVDYNNSPAGDRMAGGRVCDFVDSSWQRQSFKK
jgi:hypothetical protein